MMLCSLHPVFCALNKHVKGGEGIIFMKTVDAEKWPHFNTAAELFLQCQIVASGAFCWSCSSCNNLDL